MISTQALRRSMCLELLPARRRWLWLLLMAQLLLPILGYGCWMLVRAVHYGAWTAFGAVFGGLVGLVLAGAEGADYRLRHHPPDAFRLLPRLNVRLPYVLFFPMHWLRHAPLSLLLTKISSCLLLVGVCRLYPTDDYDERLLLIGLMLAIIAHSGLGRQLCTFEQRYLLLLPKIKCYLH